MTPGSDCVTGKAQFTKDGARAQRSVLRAKGDPDGLALRAYQCAWCRCWHVGHLGRRGWRERRRRRAAARP